MLETQSIADQSIATTLSGSSSWIEPLLGCALGVAGGLLQSALSHTSTLSGGLLGTIFGLVFGLFFAQRASSPGAGLIWGLGSSFLLWTLTARDFFHLAAVTGHQRI